MAQVVKIPSGGYTHYIDNSMSADALPLCVARASAEIFVTHRQTSNIRSNLVGNELADHSDVVGASPVGAAPSIS